VIVIFRPDVTITKGQCLFAIRRPLKKLSRFQKSTAGALSRICVCLHATLFLGTLEERRSSLTEEKRLETCNG
jgi:hypothetical protein